MYHEEISRVRGFFFFGFLFAGGQARQCKAKRVQMGDRQASVYIFFALSFFFFYNVSPSGIYFDRSETPITYVTLPYARRNPFTFLSNFISPWKIAPNSKNL